MAGGYDSVRKLNGPRLADRAAGSSPPEPEPALCWVMPDGAARPIRAQVVNREQTATGWRITLEVQQAESGQGSHETPSP